MATGWALLWRALVTLGAGGALLMVLGGGVLGIAHSYLRASLTLTPSSLVVLAAITVAALVVAGLFGFTVVVSGTALLVRNHLDHRLVDAPTTGRRRHLALGSSLATALTTAPKVMLFGAVCFVVFGLLFLLTPILMLLALGYTGWLLARGRVPRRKALRCLAWAIPFAPAARAAVAAPAVHASLLNRAPVKLALRAARRQSLRSRFLTGLGLVVMAAFNVGLGLVTLHGLRAGAGFLVVMAASLLLAGLALGLLAHTPARPGGGLGGGVAPRQPWAGVGPLHPSRRRRVGAITAFAVLVALPFGFFSPASATTPSVITINDASDASTTVDPTQCQGDAPCGIRAALALAGQQLAAGEQPDLEVDSSMDGATIELAGTLQVPSGVFLDAVSFPFTIDAHHAFRTVETVSVPGREGSVTLNGLHIIGGRSAYGGAGLFSASARVTLDDDTFTDNVSGGTGGGDGSGYDGGAVDVPTTQLMVEDSTFTHNQATAGHGGAVAADQLNLTNSTLSDNTGKAGQPDGGAIYATGGGHVSQVTVGGAGGIAGTAEAPLQVTNTLVTGPAGSWNACAQITAADDPNGAPSAGNVDAAGTCNGIAADPSDLAPLADNGGAAQTMIPNAGNPAIGAGSADWCEASDQNGNSRDPSMCDAGAVQTDHDVAPPAPSEHVSIAADTGIRTLGQDATFTVSEWQDWGTPFVPGTLQMVENDTPLGDPVTLTDNSATTYQLSVPGLSQGPHTLVARFTPDAGGYHVDSDPYTVGVQAPSLVSISTTAPVQAGDAATLVATVGPASGAPDPNAPAATGTVTFYYNGLAQTDAPVVDGVARLPVASLTSGQVNVMYSGDNAWSFSMNNTPNIFDGVPSTTTTASVVAASVEHGQDTQVKAKVTDSNGHAPVGGVGLVVDRVNEDSATLNDDGTATLSGTFPVGTHTGYVTYNNAQSWWTGSRSADFTFTVVPSHSSITVGYDSANPARYPDQPHITFTATGEAGQATTVQLMDGQTVLAQQSVTLSDGGFSGSFDLPAGTFDVGTRTVHAELEPTGSTAGSTSADLPVTVAPGASHVSASNDGAQVGQPAVINVHVDGSLPATLTVTDAAGAQVTQQHLTSADTTFTYTPTGTSTALHLAVAFDDGRYVDASSDFTLNASKADVATPTMTWVNDGYDFDTQPPHLLLTYPTGAGLAAPTGSVSLIDSSGNWHGYGDVVDGKVDVTLYGDSGTCYCGQTGLRVVYSGDDLYGGRTDHLPDLTTAGRATTTTVRVETSNMLPGQPATLRVNVATTTPGSTVPTGHVTVLLDGSPFAEGDLTAASNGTLEVTGYLPTTASGSVTFTATYTPTISTWNASQGTVAGRVLDPAPPTVTLWDMGTPQIGQPEQIWAGALVNDHLLGELDTTAPIKVYDDEGALLGTGTWGPNGTGTITITPVHGGDRTLTATYGYGTLSKLGTSQPLDFYTPGLPVKMNVSAEGAASVGQPVNVRVELGTLPAGDNVNTVGSMTAHLTEYGNDVATAKRLMVDASGKLSAEFTYIPDRKGRLDLVAYTDGDGGDVGYSAGGVTLNVAAATLQLRPNTVNTYVTLGKTFTTPSVTLLPSVGTPSDGQLNVDLVDADGTSTRVCQVTLPATTCTVSTVMLTPGTYTLSYTYSGSSAYDDITAPVAGGTVHVQAAAAKVTTTYSVSPQQWVAGSQVTATFHVTDPYDATGRNPGNATGSIRLDSAAYGGLCLIGITDAQSATCDFTVPWPSTALRQQQVSALTTTFTPSVGYSTPGTDAASLDGIARCFTATGNLALQGTTNKGYPTITVVDGGTCHTASTSGVWAGTLNGYVEGSTLGVRVDPAAVTNGFEYTGIQVAPGAPAGGPSTLVAPDASGRVTVANLTANTTLTPQFTWAPTCVEVDAGYETPYGWGMPTAQYKQDEVGNPSFLQDPPSSVQLQTPSNCASPSGRMSASEQADLNKGIGHYVVGTDVTVAPDLDRSFAPTTADPDWQLVSMPGTTKGADGAYHLTATANASGTPTVVYGVFRWSPLMCQPVTTQAGPGGTVAVTHSSFPSALEPLEDPTGTCTTPAGAPGYLDGTTVTATATPKNSETSHGTKPSIGETYLAAWPNATAADLADRGITTAVPGSSEVPGTSGHISGDPYAAHTATGVVSPTGPTSFAATFGRIDCVPVSIGLDGLSMDQVNLTPGNCEAVPTDQSVGGNTVRYYSGDTKVAFSSTAPTKQVGDETLNLRWDASFNADAGTTTWPNGTQSDTFYGEPQGSFTIPAAMEGPAGIVLSGNYVESACHTATVSTRKIDGYSFDAQGGDCPDGQTNDVRTDVQATMPAAAAKNGVRAQWQIWSHDPADILAARQIDANPADPTNPADTAYPMVAHGDVLSYRGRQSVDLTFCKPLADVEQTELVDADGQTITAQQDSSGNPVPYTTAPDPTKVLQADNSPCADDDAPVDTSIQLGLTDAESYHWSVYGWINNNTGDIALGDKSPAIQVGHDGEISDSWTAVLTPHCYQLQIKSDRINVDTPPNCAGVDPAQMMYNPGTVVHLSFQTHQAMVLAGWHGTDDNSAGDHTTVTMNAEEHVDAVYQQYPLDFTQSVEDVASNVTQRIVAGVAAAANTVILDTLSVVLTAGSALGYLGDALDAIGLGGAFADDLKTAGNAMSATSDALNSLNTCFTEWATGSTAGTSSVSSGALTASGSGEDAEKAANSAASVIAKQTDKLQNNNAASSGLQKLNAVRAAINLFTTNFSAYTQDPTAAWSNFTTQMNNCFESKGNAMVDAY